MENQDILFEQIKTAAQNSENQTFDAMDKIWNRVEDKLDNKVLKKQSNNWKKIAVAASVLLVVSLGYQFLKADDKINIPKNEIVTVDTLETVLRKVIAEKGKVAEVENPIIKKDPDIILQKEISKDVQVAKNESTVPSKLEEPTNAKDDVVAKKSKKTYSNFGKFLKGQIYSANVVHNNGYLELDSDTVKTKIVSQKIEPLVVIDGNAVADRKANGVKKLSEMDKDEVESVVFLVEPLYIINGVQYTEEQMFGPNPTSPYAPLDKQEIISIEILQDAEAVEKYGEKGKKGVVIVKTKYGSPVK
jgi:hypothetical protein